MITASDQYFLGATCPGCRRIVKLEWHGDDDGWRFIVHSEEGVACPESEQQLSDYARRRSLEEVRGG